MQPILTLSPYIAVLVPIVMALVSLVKLYSDSRWSPLFALAFGIAGSFLFPAATIATTIFSGLIIGLTASGLYSGAKTIAGA